MKRVLLALTFVVALTAAGLGLGSNASAWHGCHDGYGPVRYGYRAYPVYYGGGWGGYGGYYPRHYHRSHWHGHRGYHDHGGFSISFGF